MQLNWNELKCGWQRMDGVEKRPEAPPAAAVDLSGTWQLADCRRIYPGGKLARPWAGSASGCLFYGPDGYMFEAVNYPDHTGKIGCISYCGHYEIVGDRVYHYITVSADIRDVGTVRERTFLFEQDLLTLCVSPAPAGGPGSSMQYLWRRADPSRPRAGRSAWPGHVHQLF